MAKNEGGGDVVSGLMSAGKALVTGAPSAVLVDTAMALWAPATLSPTVREVARFGLGTAFTAAALALGAPSDYAAGPMVANGGVALVQAGRSFGLVDRIRAAYPAAAR